MQKLNVTTIFAVEILWRIDGEEAPVGSFTYAEPLKVSWTWFRRTTREKIMTLAAFFTTIIDAVLPQDTISVLLYHNPEWHWTWLSSKVQQLAYMIDPFYWQWHHPPLVVFPEPCTYSLKLNYFMVCILCISVCMLGLVMQVQYFLVSTRMCCRKYQTAMCLKLIQVLCQTSLPNSQDMSRGKCVQDGLAQHVNLHGSRRTNAK